MIVILATPNAAKAAPEDHFVTTWNTDIAFNNSPTSITVPIIGGPYDVDWNNDGVFDEFGLHGTTNHDFGMIGIYTIRITGQFDSIRFSSNVAEELLSVDQWGTNQWSTMRDAFRGAENLHVPALDVPDFSAVDNMSGMFYGTTVADPDTSNWDTSSVTDMSNMFRGAVFATPDTGNWDTSSVENMNAMFLDASSSDPDTSNWDTSQVVNMGAMFANAVVAQPDTSSWDTSKVITMGTMFRNATLANPETRNWDTSSVENMSLMFLDAVASNPDTSNWDTSRVRSAERMFLGAALANPDTSGWDTSAINNMREMFAGAQSANPDTSGWNTSQVTDMGSMFANATAANPNTSNWDVSSVEFMWFMFAGATLANPDTSGWNTSGARLMSGMFSGASSANPDVNDWDTSGVEFTFSMFEDAVSFDRDIGSWDISTLFEAFDMFAGTALSFPNYDSLLIGWSDQPHLPSVQFGGGDSRYCSDEAVAARDFLENTSFWFITDGGRCEIPSAPGSEPDLTPESDTGQFNDDDFTVDVYPDFFVECSGVGNTITLFTDNPAANSAVGTHSCANVGTETTSVASPLEFGVNNMSYTEGNPRGESTHSPSLAVMIDTISLSGFEQ